MFQNAYYSEIIQTFVAAIGFSLGIWAVWDARRDEIFWARVLSEERKMGRSSGTTEARYEIARVLMASELATVVAHVTLLCIGISGLFLAPPDRYTRIYDTELLGVQIGRYGMVLVTCVLCFKSIIRRRGRINYTRARRRDDSIIGTMASDRDATISIIEKVKVDVSTTE